MAAQAGSPTGTVDVVKKLIAGGAAAPIKAVDEPKIESTENGTEGAAADDIAQANTAAQIADTAQKLDSNEAKSAEL